MMDIRNAIYKIFMGRGLLFTGSGFSVAADSVIGKIPSALQLANILDDKSGSDSGGDLGEAAESFIVAKGEYQLIPILRDCFTCKNTTDAQDIISQQKWMRIYTTNYDDIIEIGGRKSGIARQSVALADRLHDFKELNDIVIHLNGSINELTPEKLNDEFKLTNSSYLTRDFQNSEWISLFTYDLKDADAIFFVGFSMKYDLDIKRIVSSEAYKDKCYFIVSTTENELNKKQLSRFGSVLEIGTDGFAKLIKEEFEHFTPPVVELPYRFLCFEQYKTFIRPELKDDDAYNLFFKGNFSLPIIYYSIKEPVNYPYFIYRDRLDFALDSITNNGCRRMVVHSDLGNGKTLFVKGLALLLTDKGYKVFEFKRDEVSLLREVNKICSIKDNNVVIILENYSSYKDVLSRLKLVLRDQILIVTERSVKNDMGIDSLEKDFGQFYEIDLNVLSEKEIVRLVQIFDKFGLWGRYANLRKDQKIDKIIHDYHRSLCPVLLDIIDSPTIIGRFKEEISKIRKGTSLYDVLIMVLISKLLELDLDVDMLSVAIDDNLLGNSSMRRNPFLREFIDFQSMEITLRSSVFSEAILRNVIDPIEIGRVLIKSFKRINTHRGEAKYKRILFSFMSSSNLNHLIDRRGDGNNSILINFFEKIRDCEFCKNNPHYWLQYAIIKLNEPDYVVARTLFSNAYAYAKNKQDFDTYQIDNHYARYMLENSVFNIDDPNFMETIEKVQAILTEPNHLKRTKYYPFRVAQNYLPFFNKYKSRMTKKEKMRFSAYCSRLLVMIDIYKKSTPNYSHRRDVSNAQKGLEQIVSEIDAH